MKTFSKTGMGVYLAVVTLMTGCAIESLIDSQIDERITIISNPAVRIYGIQIEKNRAGNEVITGKLRYGLSRNVVKGQIVVTYMDSNRKAIKQTCTIINKRRSHHHHGIKRHSPKFRIVGGNNSISKKANKIEISFESDVSPTCIDKKTDNLQSG